MSSLVQGYHPPMQPVISTHASPNKVFLLRRMNVKHKSMYSIIAILSVAWWSLIAPREIWVMIHRNCYWVRTHAHESCRSRNSALLLLSFTWIFWLMTTELKLHDWVHTSTRTFLFTCLIGVIWTENLEGNECFFKYWQKKALIFIGYRVLILFPRT